MKTFTLAVLTLCSVGCFSAAERRSIAEDAIVYGIHRAAPILHKRMVKAEEKFTADEIGRFLAFITREAEGIADDMLDRVRED